ncbi:MAG TPA: hypothetical protein PLU87_13445 [Sedimentisphaerales bacterium]|nr:hypothetical protein [Sedimentisphaerales bacterium]HRS10960.1 hypothetical protein [Sedimentisphaerales bacterium]HRV48654.1 hypothetical protein [Sedimentisphaerales bacterium]
MKLAANAVVILLGVVSAQGPCFAVQGQPQVPPGVDLPASWLADWRDLPVQFRPLQIVHGVPEQQVTFEAMMGLKDLGLGGIVCNVAFADYLRSEESWEVLVRAVESCSQAGLRVWIYDEDGYPSGAAGGLVLAENAGFEALALAYDPCRADPFVLRPAYEHTHASNNYYAARRYPNLIDPAAVECFVRTTHDVYYERLKPFFGTTIEALFTDEPSLMAVNIGPLPDEVRSKVRVVDRLDPNVSPLPSVPWVADLPDLYRRCYGQDLLAARRSLFEGDSEQDRRIRQQYWALVADLLAGRYYGRIQQWAQTHRVASSGHILWEETLEHHPALEGNSLKVLGRMDVPGLDLLTSRPEAVIHTGWMTAVLPASAALLNGGRRVMTEVSDFSETMAGKGPASLAEMCATAAWQAAFGVTEFTLYYNRQQRSPQEYRAYGDFVGRLNALLREARPAPRVLLYYPIADVWAEYKPVAEKLTKQSQSALMRRIIDSFMNLGQRMTRSQISFVLADHEILAGAHVQGRRICVGRQCFDALLLPADVELPAPAGANVRRFERAGGRVVRDVPGETIRLDALAALYDSGLPSVPQEWLVVGRFTRDRRDLVLVVNVGASPCDCEVSAPQAAQWIVADPATGRMEPVSTERPGWVSLSLPPRTACILVGPADE